MKKNYRSKISLLVTLTFFYFSSKASALLLVHANYPRAELDEKESQSAVFLSTVGNLFMFGICDGYGPEGSKLAHYAAKSIPSSIAKENEESLDILARDNLIASFNNTLKGYDQINGKVSAVLALFDLKNLFLHVANVGDIRAVLSNAIEGVNKNNPRSSDVCRQFEELPELQNGRDIRQKHGFLTCDPSLGEVRLDGTQQFLILANSDLWDVVASSEAVAFVHDGLNKRSITVDNITVRQVREIARDLVMLAEQRSRERVSVKVMLIFFQRLEAPPMDLYSQISPYARKKQLSLTGSRSAPTSPRASVNFSHPSSAGRGPFLKIPRLSLFKKTPPNCQP